MSEPDTPDVAQVEHPSPSTLTSKDPNFFDVYLARTIQNSRDGKWTHYEEGLARVSAVIAGELPEVGTVDLFELTGQEAQDRWTKFHEDAKRWGYDPTGHLDPADSDGMRSAASPETQNLGSGDTKDGNATDQLNDGSSTKRPRQSWNSETELAFLYSLVDAYWRGKNPVGEGESQIPHEVYVQVATENLLTCNTAAMRSRLQDIKRRCESFRAKKKQDNPDYQYEPEKPKQYKKDQKAADNAEDRDVVQQNASQQSKLTTMFLLPCRMADIIIVGAATIPATALETATGNRSTDAPDITDAADILMHMSVEHGEPEAGDKG